MRRTFVDTCLRRMVTIDDESARCAHLALQLQGLPPHHGRDPLSPARSSRTCCRASSGSSSTSRPDFPVLRRFLDFWTRNIEGKLHSVKVAHADLVTPGRMRHASVSAAARTELQPAALMCGALPPCQARAGCGSRRAEPHDRAIAPYRASSPAPPSRARRRADRAASRSGCSPAAPWCSSWW